MLTRRATLALPLAGLLVAAGCASAPPPPDGPEGTAALTRAIRALGPGIDPDEAATAARVAYDATSELARAYRITDPPLIHNAKVNLGLKPRGLCWQWADDMETRLAQEHFRTLALHRAIANADNPFRIDHSTVILSRSGDPMDEGIVLDPWRRGGKLFWVPTLEDTRYRWVPRRDVMAERRGESRKTR